MTRKQITDYIDDAVFKVMDTSTPSHMNLNFNNYNQLIASGSQKLYGVQQADGSVKVEYAGIEVRKTPRPDEPSFVVAMNGSKVYI